MEECKHEANSNCMNNISWWSWIIRSPCLSMLMFKYSVVFNWCPKLNGSRQNCRQINSFSFQPLLIKTKHYQTLLILVNTTRKEIMMYQRKYPTWLRENSETLQNKYVGENCRGFMEILSSYQQNYFSNVAVSIRIISRPNAARWIFVCKIIIWKFKFSHKIKPESSFHVKIFVHLPLYRWGRIHHL